MAVAAQRRASQACGTKRGGARTGLHAVVGERQVQVELLALEHEAHLGRRHAGLGAQGVAGLSAAHAGIELNREGGTREVAGKELHGLRRDERGSHGGGQAGDRHGTAAGEAWARKEGQRGGRHCYHVCGVLSWRQCMSVHIAEWLFSRACSA